MHATAHGSPFFQARGSNFALDRDDVEATRRADFDDAFGFDAAERVASDDEPGFARDAISLPLDDDAGEGDRFEVADREAIVVTLKRASRAHQDPERAQNRADCVTETSLFAREQCCRS